MDQDQVEVLSQAALRSEIQKICQGPSAGRLLGFARRLIEIRGLKPRYHEEDLVQEAASRLCARAKPYPKNLDVLTFLFYSMRSISWRWKREEIAEGESQFPLTENGDEVEFNSPIHSPETALHEKDEFIEFYNSISDDPVAQKLLLGVAQGIRGVALQAYTGMNEKELATKRRKLIRRIKGSADE